MKLKRRRLLRVAILPSLFTIGNLLCGFGALTSAINGNFLLSAWLILIGLAIFDALDGMIARATKTISPFGAQLDSLADVVSFGIAPAFLSYTIINQSNSHLISDRFTFFICAFYVACAALRLARFNIEHPAHEFDLHLYFNGLPTPAAACLVCTLIIFNYEVSSNDFYRFLPNRLIPVILPFAIIVLATLMVSRIRYVHIINRTAQTKHPFIRLAEIILISLMIAFQHEITLVLIFLLYVLSGPVSYVYYKLYSSSRYKYTTETAVNKLDQPVEGKPR